MTIHASTDRRPAQAKTGAFLVQSPATAARTKPRDAVRGASDSEPTFEALLESAHADKSKDAVLTEKKVTKKEAHAAHGKSEAKHESARKGRCQEEPDAPQESVEETDEQISPEASAETTSEPVSVDEDAPAKDASEVVGDAEAVVPEASVELALESVAVPAAVISIESAAKADVPDAEEVAELPQAPKQVEQPRPESIAVKTQQKQPKDAVLVDNNADSVGDEVVAENPVANVPQGEKPAAPPEDLPQIPVARPTAKPAQPAISSREATRNQAPVSDAAVAATPSDAMAVASELTMTQSPVVEAAKIVEAKVAEELPGKANQASDGPAISTLPAHSQAKREIESANAAQPAQESHGSEHAEPFEQIVLGLRSKLDPRNGKAEIELQPPNLGTMKVTVTLQNGLLTAQFQSSSDLVRDLLKSNIEKLKNVLEGQGVAVDKLAVEPPPANSQSGTDSRGQGSFGSASHDGRSAGEYRQDRANRARDDDTFARAMNEAQDANLDLVA